MTEHHGPVMAAQNATTVPGLGKGPDVMHHADRMKVRASANLALRLYPGPVGEVLNNELISWEQFGYRLGNGQLIDRLIKFLDTELNSRTQSKDS